MNDWYIFDQNCDLLDNSGIKRIFYRGDYILVSGKHGEWEYKKDNSAKGYHPIKDKDKILLNIIKDHIKFDITATCWEESIRPNVKLI